MLYQKRNEKENESEKEKEKKQRSNVRFRFYSRSVLVQVKGLEPPRLSAPDPKSGAAANYATPAREAKIKQKFRIFKFYCK